ncbi:MAG: hypothetical protein M1838_002429 [Thelocarpon superellum]|nr:MAG: hypothetical protein M1838_002429 [Thelocarpon superellum]
MPASVRARKSLEIDGKIYETDSWTNTPESIISAVPRRLHLQPSHPIALTRQIIEARFPAPTYRHLNSLFPVVSVGQNFDSLGFPANHPGRSRTDTYYVNKDTVLRTHTSAHQADTFRANESPGFLISADVYRRDAIDRSHYPIFHQMEGARMWDRSKVPHGDIAKAVLSDLESLPRHNVEVEDPNPTTHPERNPLQSQYHSAEETEAIAAHLKRSLEVVVADIFSRAKNAAAAAGDSSADARKPLRVRWVEAYFPFTSPSYELEVFWNGDWLEVLGCGVVAQSLPIAAGVPDQLGWAFGVGLERIAMLLFSIPDIRLFWSRDPRFLSQFSASDLTRTPRYAPFSRYPACYKDVAFWLPSSAIPISTPSSTVPATTSTTAPTNSSGGALPAEDSVHENDIMELVRDVAGDEVEDVQLVDAFTHPKTRRKSLCYRINYRSLYRTLTNDQANALHDAVRARLVERLGVALR